MEVTRLLRYILKRLLWMIPVIIGVSVIIFTILYFAPGEPAMIALGDSATPETIAVFNETYGYNGTYLERLSHYILGLFRGDLGISYLTSQPVLDELLSRFSVTMTLASSEPGGGNCGRYLRWHRFRCSEILHLGYRCHHYLSFWRVHADFLAGPHADSDFLRKFEVVSVHRFWRRQVLYSAYPDIGV